MTAQQRRKRRMIRRFAPTVALCAVIAIIAAACVCALARPVERGTQPEAASTETVAAATKIAPAITKAAEQITKTPEAITPEAPEETAPEEQPEQAPEEISRYAALHDTDYILPAEAVFFSTKAYNDNIVAVIGNHIFCSIEEVTQ